MSPTLLLLFCLGYSLAETALRNYHYVNIKKSWYEARSYCQQHYTDLAIFSSVEDTALAVRPAVFDTLHAWIGLLDETQDWKGFMTNKSNSWKWSATGQGSKTGYQNFDLPTEPNFNNAVEECGFMAPLGTWNDSNCANLKPFVCFTETTSSPLYTYVDSAMSWWDALAYCRQHHTDLVMIEDAETNLEILNLKPAVDVWIGMSRKPWTWVDGSSVMYNGWMNGKPLRGGTYPCVAENSAHKWKNADCAFLHCFVCQEDMILKTTVTINFHTTADLTDPNIISHILQQLNATLRGNGYTTFNIKWTLEPVKITIP